MKKLAFLLLLLSQQMLAGIPLSPVDELSKYDQDLESLSRLEEFVDQTHVTKTQLIASGHPLSAGLLEQYGVEDFVLGNPDPDPERYLDVPGFLWGFCCSFLGIFFVYSSIKDPVSRKSEGTKSILGCLLGTLFWAGLYLWMVFVAIN